jgi:two-component system response regulator HydG
MRARNLQLSDVFEFEPDGGVMTFAGERVVLLDAVAMGLLRSQLITSFGMAGARAVLTRFGYSHGWRVAEAMKTAIPWDDEREWRVAGGRLHRLHGMVSFEPVKAPSTQPPPFAESVWPDSYEAEQHLLHQGRADEGVCWSLVGFASGYLSFVNGRTVYCKETACRAKGDPVCRLVAREKEDWPEAQRAELAYYESDCLAGALERLQRSWKTLDRKLSARRREQASEDEGGLVARSSAMKAVVAQARRVAAVDATVLLSGESGSGKERLARLVHEASPRQGGPFIAINCAAMPEALLESELFGHARGAFTGAVSDRVGLFEAAKGGTLLLDEVGELPAAMQAKLLRVLQEREVRRVGENKTRPIDVRVVAATHRELTAEVRAGRFREDLLFRLRVVELRVPPLRERAEDIVPLARLALAESARRARVPARELSAGVTRRLVSYRWPGNVRELLNAMERATVLATTRTLSLADLPDELSAPAPTHLAPGGGQTLAEVEQRAILATLEAEGGNRARTAARLGIGQATLFRKLKAYQRDGVRVTPAA